MGDIIKFKLGKEDTDEEAKKAFSFLKELMARQASQIIIIGVAPDWFDLEVFGDENCFYSVIALEVARNTIMDEIMDDDSTDEKPN